MICEKMLKNRFKSIQMVIHESWLNSKSYWSKEQWIHDSPKLAPALIGRAALTGSFLCGELAPAQYIQYIATQLSDPKSDIEDRLRFEFFNIRPHLGASSSRKSKMPIEQSTRGSNMDYRGRDTNDQVDGSAVSKAKEVSHRLIYSDWHIDRLF